MIKSGEFSRQDNGDNSVRIFSALNVKRENRTPKDLGPGDKSGRFTLFLTMVVKREKHGKRPQTQR